MTSRHKAIQALTRKVTDLDERFIDELYGLEPVFRPEEAVGHSAEPTAFAAIQCPYCAEQFETRVDLTAGPSTYIEDCYVCCQPIELFVEIDSVGRLRCVHAQRMD
jgi:hypothetical protein